MRCFLRRGFRFVVVVLDDIYIVLINFSRCHASLLLPRANRSFPAYIRPFLSPSFRSILTALSFSKVEERNGLETHSTDFAFASPLLLFFHLDPISPRCSSRLTWRISRLKPFESATKFTPLDDRTDPWLTKMFE